MNVKKELLDLISQLAAVLELPVVEQIYLPEPQPHADNHTEFGVVALSDNSAGLYYAWLGDAQKGMNERYQVSDYIGRSPLNLARLFAANDEADCSLGLAAINAISQSVFKHCDISMDIAGDSFANLNIQAGDHVGMVGYFPPLVKRLRDKHIRLTVIEKKTQFLQQHENFEVCDDASKLLVCNKIFSTAATLLNGSIDTILKYSAGAEKVVVLGPTASFFPDPLFSRNVSAVGGTRISDAARAISDLSAGKGLGDAAYKYVLQKDEYRGFLKLLQQCRS